MKSEVEKGVMVLTPEMKQIDVNNSVSFNDDLKSSVKSGEKYVLDLRNIHFMDSTGLGVIVSALRKASESKGEMVLCGTEQAVKVLFDMVRISSIARIFADRDQAVGALNRE
ncbi:MAG: STAS domain-containing protein [Spirochaetales bacterium]|nr:STAS domain-containing protein [Spirochaetales bacterium]